AGLGEGVAVTGAVADVRPWLARASVVVAPLRISRGVQNKVLEAMAMARPVVASPQAFEGIAAEPGRDLIVAEGWAAEAGAVIALLDDPARGEAIGGHARARVAAHYGWAARLAPLDAMLAHI
ncbi:MAG TPA: glycosyltransferase, partial [Sphingomonas sp.]